MKQVKIFTPLCIVAGMLLLSSCNSKTDKKAADNPADSTTMETPATTSPSGPVSTMIVRSKVADYAKWITSYESHDSTRLANGLHNYVVARGTEDSNILLVAMIMDDVKKAKEFAGSKDLKDRMKESGVVGPPAVMDFLEAIMNDTTAIQATVRVMIRHKVKDWDAWKKSFDSHKQTRMDAGLVDRVVSHTAGDTHNVTLVFAVTDMDKAKAFMNSDDLKNKMKEAGVEGPPDFFYYKIAKKY
ncbi:MAG: hypothetical protein SGI96_14655 [Bacteroidota bacterium]|nr:hypothetical protein [Bacteroidota bacterium]